MDDCESVAKRYYNLFHTLVGSNKIVELKYSRCLSVEFLSVVDHFSVPQRVVGNNEPVGVHIVEHQVVVFQILSFIGIHKHEVELSTHLRYYVAGVADVQVDVFPLLRLAEMLSDEILQLVVDFDCVQLRPRHQTFRHCQG